MSAETATTPDHLRATVEWLRDEAERLWDCEAFDEGDQYFRAAGDLSRIMVRHGTDPAATSAIENGRTERRRNRPGWLDDAT